MDTQLDLLLIVVSNPTTVSCHLALQHITNLWGWYQNLILRCY
jgi:hypothetical protein